MSSMRNTKITNNTQSPENCSALKLQFKIKFRTYKKKTEIRFAWISCKTTGEKFTFLRKLCLQRDWLCSWQFPSWFGQGCLIYHRPWFFLQEIVSKKNISWLPMITSLGKIALRRYSVHMWYVQVQWRSSARFKVRGDSKCK